MTGPYGGNDGNPVPVDTGLRVSCVVSLRSAHGWSLQSPALKVKRASEGFRGLLIKYIFPDGVWCIVIK